MNAEEDFEKLFEDAHEQIIKALDLFHVYAPDNAIKGAEQLTKSIIKEVHLIEPLVKLKPELEGLFEYELNSSNLENKFKLYSETIKNPSPGMTSEQICILGLLWRAIYLGKNLSVIAKGANKTVILEQALVAMCTAAECYIKDCFALMLRDYQDYAKSYIGSLSMPVKEFGKYDFKPIENADKVFLEKDGNSFKLFENGKKLYKDVIDFDAFVTKEQEESVWGVFQTRHCIIHNGGKPDEIWKSKMKGVPFKRDQETLRKYLEYLHQYIHDFYYRLYVKQFKKKPKSVREGKDKVIDLF